MIGVKWTPDFLDFRVDPDAGLIYTKFDTPWTTIDSIHKLLHAPFSRHGAIEILHTWRDEGDDEIGVQYAVLSSGEETSFKIKTSRCDEDDDQEDEDREPRTTDAARAAERLLENRDDSAVALWILAQGI